MSCKFISNFQSVIRNIIRFFQCEIGFRMRTNSETQLCLFAGQWPLTFCSFQCRKNSSNWQLHFLSNHWLYIPLECPPASGINSDVPVVGMSVESITRYGIILISLRFIGLLDSPDVIWILLYRLFDWLFNKLRTGLLNCLNARSRGLIFRHRASCI